MKVVINTKSAVTTVTVTTELTAKHFCGASLVTLKDAKGNALPFAFGLAKMSANSSVAPATKAGVTFYYSDNSKPLSITYPVTSTDVEAITDELGLFLRDAKLLEEQMTAAYNDIKEAAKAVTVEK